MIKKIILLILFFIPLSLYAQPASVGVATFSVQGPQNLQYLSIAARDAVQGVLTQEGCPAHAIATSLNPDRLNPADLKKNKSEALVTGRINIVGETCRVLIRWIDAQGKNEQTYLQVANLNQLIPELESFTRSRLMPSLASGQAPFVSEISSMPAKPIQKEEIPKKNTEISSVDKTQLNSKSSVISSDFKTQSQRLPYEVRAMAYGDVDGDGQEEILLTNQNELYLYKLEEDGKLRELAKYSGKNLDHFVKVDYLPSWGDEKKNWIILTNLRGDQAASQILSFENSAFKTIFKDIPYQLRAVPIAGKYQLWGEAYRARGVNSHSIYELSIEGKSLKILRKVNLPSEAELYSYDFIKKTEIDDFDRDLALLSSSGRVKFFKSEKEKLKSIWTSRESYGASANDVEVEVKNPFNQVVSDYYVVPIGLKVINSTSQVELILSKSDTLLDDIVFKKPVVTSGHMVRLKWNGLSFDEVWESKRIDGSIMDYLVIQGPVSQRLLVAVRMRDQGFLEGVGRKDSVLLTYDLN